MLKAYQWFQVKGLGKNLLKWKLTFSIPGGGGGLSLCMAVHSPFQHFLNPWVPTCILSWSSTSSHPPVALGFFPVVLSNLSHCLQLRPPPSKLQSCPFRLVPCRQYVLEP